MITQEHYDELDRLLLLAQSEEERLTDWENDFVSSWVDKLDAEGLNVRVSDKQQFVLDSIARKLGEA